MVGVKVGSSLAQFGEPLIDRKLDPYYSLRDCMGLRVQSLRAQSLQ